MSELRCRRPTRRVKEFLGAYIGGFTVPFRTIKDFIAQFDVDERTYPFSSAAPFLAPTISNLPFLSGVLPPTPSITRQQPITRETPALRQLTGLTIQTKTFLEQELDRLEITDLWPKTGVPKIDRLIVDQTGNIMEKAGQAMQASEEYPKWTDEDKTEFIKQLFSLVKKEAKKAILKENAQELANDINEKLQGLSLQEKKEFITKQYNKGLLPEEIIELINFE